MRKLPPKPKKKLKPDNISKNAPYLVWLYAIGVVLITFIILSPLLKCDFLTWDDPVFVIQNPNVHSISANTIGSMFSSFVQGNYCPLSILSLAIDFWISGGLHPELFHFTNLILHLANTLLVFFIAYQICNRQAVAAIVASLLFAIHPMHLESVAWVSERRDVLYSFFYLAGMLAYLKYIRNLKMEIGNRSLKMEIGKYYIYALLLFIASLFSKGQAVTFPIALLFIDYINSRKFNKSVWLEKIPFFLLAVLFGCIALIAQKSTGAIQVVHLPWYYPLFAGAYGLFTYLVKSTVPYHLSVHHPYPFSIHNSPPLVFYAAPIILIAFAILIFKKLRTDRYITGGLLFFLVSIFPVLQFLTVGETIIMERYTYIPYVGLFLIVGHIAANTEKYFPSDIKYIFLSAIPLWLIILCVITYNRESAWHDPVSFWTDAINQYPNNKFAYNNRGCILMDFQKYDEAFSDFNKGIAIDSTFGRLFVDRGVCYAYWKKYDLALKDYAAGMRLDTTLCQPYIARAEIEANVYHQPQKALDDFRTALKKNPGDIQIEEQIKQLETQLKIK